MNIERLQHTLRLLDNPGPRFDMFRWDCCAFGLECQSDYGQQQGLGLGFRFHCYSHYIEPQYEGYRGVDAAANYYDIPHGAAMWLFNPLYYDCRSRFDAAILPAQVQERIQKVLDGHMVHSRSEAQVQIVEVAARSVEPVEAIGAALECFADAVSAVRDVVRAMQEVVSAAKYVVSTMQEELDCVSEERNARLARERDDFHADVGWQRVYRAMLAAPPDDASEEERVLVTANPTRR